MTTTTNTENEPNPDPLAQEKEAYKQLIASRMAKIAADQPNEGLPAKSEWWVPSIDFNFDVKGRIPLADQEKLNACLGRIIEQKYAPEVVGPAVDEARGYLAGEEDLLRRFDGLFSSAFWDTMYRHGLEKEKKNAGSSETSGGCGL